MENRAYQMCIKAIEEKFPGLKEKSTYDANLLAAVTLVSNTLMVPSSEVKDPKTFFYSEVRPDAHVKLAELTEQATFVVDTALDYLKTIWMFKYSLVYGTKGTFIDEVTFYASLLHTLALVMPEQFTGNVTECISEL